MRTCIKRVQDQASAGKARDKFDKPLKPQNSDLYSSHLHIECYSFYQQCEDHFEIAKSKGHKHVPFATGFLKNHILNWWEQYKTQI